LVMPFQSGLKPNNRMICCWTTLFSVGQRSMSNCKTTVDTLARHLAKTTADLSVA